MVCPDNPRRLSAIGAVGELWIEGPLIGRGYLNEKEKTAAVFVDELPWLANTTIGRSQRQRAYRTGDLVRLDPDGSIAFLQRKEASQIKIRGQRVELADIESNIRSSLPKDSAFQIAVEAVKLQNSTDSTLLCFLGTARVNSQALDGQVSVTVAMLDARLRRLLPAYMCPAGWIPLSFIPMTGTGKTDHRALQTLGSSLTLEAIQERYQVHAARRQPETDDERLLQSLFADTLQIEPDLVSADDDFLRIGGDSIRAMRLVASARDQHNLGLTVADVFKNPVLSDLAIMLKGSGPRVDEEVPPFSLLSPANLPDSVDPPSPEQFRKQAAAMCAVEAGDIEDMYPTTSLQAALLAMTSKSSQQDYVRIKIQRLQENVDVDRFRRAWQTAVDSLPILRTRIIDVSAIGLLQVMIRNSVSCGTAANLQDYLEDNRTQSMGLGQALCRMAIIDTGKSKDSDTHERWFVLTLHHSLYDAQSLSLLDKVVDAAYRGDMPPQHLPFKNFVQTILSVDRDRQIAYWSNELQQVEATPFPVLPSPSYQPRANGHIEHNITNIEWPRTGFTSATVIKGAWAMLLSRITNSQDVVFGIVSSGRQANVTGVQSIVGPTIATLPVRIRHDFRESTVTQLLRKIQNQSTASIEFEQFGLQEIRKLGDDADQGCGFQSVLVVQSQAEEVDPVSLYVTDDKPDGLEDSPGTFSTYAIMLECRLHFKDVTVQLGYDSAVVTGAQANRLISQFELVLRQFCENPTGRLSSLQTISEQDLETIWTMNSTVPESIETCVHSMVSETAAHGTHDLAVDSWNGTLTYGELEASSTALANLIMKTATSGPAHEIIPLLFEKSKLMPVAQLSVMKAGHASVVIDTRLPLERQAWMVEKASATIIIASQAQAKIAERLLPGKVLVLDESKLDSVLTSRSTRILPRISPSAPLYVVFTSGSTGQPKGVAVSHRNFASALWHQRDRLALPSPKSRVYQGISYSFDVFWYETLQALTNGGCLCIPKEEDWLSDMGQSMRDFKVDCAMLTPTVARLLGPRHLPDLKTLVLAGEAMEPSDVAQWSSIDTLCNAYGPAGK